MLSDPSQDKSERFGMADKHKAKALIFRIWLWILLMPENEVRQLELVLSASLTYVIVSFSERLNTYPFISTRAENSAKV